MAIINTFPLDIAINDKDAWVGADFVSKSTKQYTAKAVADYLNIKGKVSIAGQMNYKFVDVPYFEESAFAFLGGGGDGTEWSNITSLVISVLDLSGQNIMPLLTYLIDEQVLFQDVEGKGSFGHYIVRGLESTEAGGYKLLTLEYIGGNGEVRLNEHYSLANFYMEIGASGVTSVDTSDTTFISMTPQNQSAGNVELTASLSATGTPDDTTFLRGDNSWVTIPIDPTNSFKEFTYIAGDLSVIRVYEDSTKTTELLTKTFTYTNGLLTQLVSLDIASNITLTKVFVYDASGNLINITES